MLWRLVAKDAGLLFLTAKDETEALERMKEFVPNDVEFTVAILTVEDLEAYSLTRDRAVAFCPCPGKRKS